jgi:hypothetical protein
MKDGWSLSTEACMAETVRRSKAESETQDDIRVACLLQKNLLFFQRILRAYGAN